MKVLQFGEAIEKAVEAHYEAKGAPENVQIFYVKRVIGNSVWKLRKFFHIFLAKIS